jgi:hypothetical protein
MQLKHRNTVAALVVIGASCVAVTGAAAQGLNLPRSRAGYWEVKTSGVNGMVRSHHSCSRGEATNLDLNGPYARFCRISFRRTLTGGIVGDGVCSHQGISGTWHVSASGDFVTHYSMDSVGTMNFPGRPPIVTRHHNEGRWVGPCPPGVATGSSD